MNSLKMIENAFFGAFGPFWTQKHVFFWGISKLHQKWPSLKLGYKRYSSMDREGKDWFQGSFTECKEVNLEEPLKLGTNHIYKEYEVISDGIMHYKDGSVYEGKWLIKLIFIDGLSEVPEIKWLEKEYRQGYGKLRTADGKVLEGQWVDDELVKQ